MLRALVYFLVIAIGAFGGTLIASILVPASVPAPYAWLIRASVVMGLVIVITHVFMARAGLSWTAFGVEPDRWRRDVPRGFVGGLLVASAWMIAIAVLSPFQLTWNSGWIGAHVAAATGGTIAMGIAEEVGYRSFGLLELRRVGGYAIAVAISSAIFVAAHIAGGVPWQAGLLVVGSASILFCVLMLETRSLPLVATLHIVTNLVQDNTLRGTPGASLFTARATLPATGRDDLAIWIALAAVNLCVAAGVMIWAKHRRAREGA